MKAEEFVKIVVDKYSNYEGVFKNHINAEDMSPTKDPLDKSLFLFYVIQLDYATKSQNLYKGAKQLYSDNKKFFNPEFILGLKETELESYLKKYLKPRYINEAINRYKLNSVALVQEYDSNPLNIFENSSTAKEALKKVYEFRGFGPKIGNFFVRTIVNAYGFEYPDIEDILPPVDIHDVRIAYFMGYIDSDDMSQKNIKEVKYLWSNACKGVNVSWLTFDKALWLLGSEGVPKSKEDILNLLEV